MKSSFHRSALAPSLMWRLGGVAVIASMTVPLTGCGSNQTATPPPPIQAPAGQMAPQSAPQANTNQGMSTATKVKILAGAAAAYYAYNKWKQSQAGKAAQAQNVQYYVSKSTGAIYYRDPKTKQAVFVTQPTKSYRPIEVPADQAQQYSRFQGYENQNTGQTLQDAGLFSVGN